jgi:oligo-alginate lyase
MRTTTLLLAAAALLPASAHAAAALQPAASAQAAAPPLLAHPRLLVDDARKADILAFIANSSQAKAYFGALLVQADAILTMPPQLRPPENASDILSAARTVLSRVVTTGLAYRLTGNTTFALRAVVEMEAAANYSDWDIVKHALDTGELCLAVGLGFDWTYDVMSASQRTRIASGLLNLGLVPFKESYEASPSSRPWWVESPSNWCIVTNGGAGVAALALLGEEGTPSWVAEEILPQAIRSVFVSAGRGSLPVTEDDGTGTGFTDDGSWWEG